MNQYKDKNIVIIGLGVTGLSCVDYFLSKNVIPRVIDTRSSPSGLDKLANNVPCHLGSLNEDWILSADLIIVSPGLSLEQEALKKAKAQGISIIGDIELFSREINVKSNKKIIAITGSNGKTTVTSLVHHILKTSGQKVAVGGNIGTPALELLKNDADFYVLELSSFQLETTYSLKANVVAIINVTEDHMDRYNNDVSLYQKAKQRIYHHAACAVYNADDERTYPLVDVPTKITVGLSQGDYYLSANKDELMHHNQPIINANELLLTGLHNYYNVLTSVAIANELGLKKEQIIPAIKSFKGLPHRFECVHQHNNIRFINDSKATNVGSTIAALNSVVYEKTLHLLLGGDGKAVDFSPLKQAIKSHKNIKIYCFGRDKHKLAALYPDISNTVDTLKEAMALISKSVVSGDVVLLSPACASIDQFNHYMQRGDVFTTLAKEPH